MSLDSRRESWPRVILGYNIQELHIYITFKIKGYHQRKECTWKGGKAFLFLLDFKLSDVKGLGRWRQ